MTAVPMTRRATAPEPCASHSGTQPSTNANDVIKIGRNRVRAPCSAASTIGAPRSRRNQDHTTLWIVAKDALARTPAGGEVAVTEVRLPMPTGHLGVDVDEVDGLVRVVAQHMPLADLMITATRDSTVHGTGEHVHPDHQGLIALAVQPTVVGTYLIDPRRSSVVHADTVTDQR